MKIETAKKKIILEEKDLKTITDFDNLITQLCDESKSYCNHECDCPFREICNEPIIRSILTVFNADETEVVLEKTNGDIFTTKKEF